MTKPSSFNLNSDYLTIAQISRNTYTLNIGGGSLVPMGFTEQNVDFAIPAEAGAIDRILINKDGQGFLYGSHMVLLPTWSSDYTKIIYGFLNIFRIAPGTLRAQLVLENQGIETASYPSMSFTIRVSSFRPPNVL